MKRILALAILAALVGGLASCTEREQTVLYKDGKYRGKPDTRPWDNVPPAYGSETWKRGDHATWENQVRTRSSGQNENRRIGH